MLLWFDFVAAEVLLGFSEDLMLASLWVVLLKRQFSLAAISAVLRVDRCVKTGLAIRTY